MNLIAIQQMKNVSQPQEYEVEQLGNVFIFKFIDSHWCVLDQEVNINDIDFHHLYTVYKIGNKYYRGFFTNKNYIDMLKNKKPERNLFNYESY